MPEAIGRFSRERAACAIGPSPRLACLASKQHSVPHRDHWVGRRTLDNVGGPKSRTTGPSRSYNRAFKRLIGIDSPVGDKSVPGERAEAKRREFVDVAQSQVATGATTLSDEIGKKLENVIDRLPGGIDVRPLIESSVQVALAAALEGLLRRRSRAD
jgi:hypothetical protein